MKNRERLKELTELLRTYNDQAYDQFVTYSKSKDYEVDFYGQVKPFADNVKQTIDEWKPLVLEWINAERPKYVYHVQINDTYDNIEITSVTAWQKDTRRRRFINTIKSIDYVLETILKQL